SKRKLLELVNKKLVSGWDDPRMPTLAGMRRRGYTPEAIRAFCERVGVAKADSVVDVGLLEYYLREDLNRPCKRVVGGPEPLKLTITNCPGEARELEAPLHPEDPAARGTRKLPFSPTLYIEREDYRDDPPKDWFRLAPGREVRLRYACLVTCNEVVRDPQTGEVVELRCTWDPQSRGGNSPDGRRVQGTSHWVSAGHAAKAEARLYDRMCLQEDAGEAGDDWKSFLNPQSLVTMPGALVEPYLADAKPGAYFQFERMGYFTVDPDTRPGRLVFNRTVTLKDSWSKI